MLIVPFRWTNDPQVPFLLATVSGILIFFNSLLSYSDPPSPYVVAGLVVGVIIVLSAVWLRTRARYRRELGAVILLASFLSLFGYSGYFLGSVLGVLGGALAISSWRPTMFSPTSSEAFSRALGPPCGRCGRHIPSWTSKCPYCGYPD